MLKEYLQIHRLSIVIIGQFNPVIIQPYWLAHKKMIRDQEAHDAKVEVIHRDIVKFSIDWANIEVQTNRFELSTTQEGLFDALKDLAISIFKILKETPISGLGINHLRYYTIPDEKRYYELGNKLAPLSNFKGILDDPRMLNLEIVQLSRPDKRPGRYTIKIQPSDRPLPSPYGILININDHYDLLDTKDTSDFTNLLEDAFTSSSKTSEEVINKLWSTLNV